MKLTIRWRLTVWNAVAFCAVLAAFAITCYFLAERSLIRQTDELLDAGFRLVIGDPKIQDNLNERLTYWVEEFKEHQELYFAAFQADRSVIARHPRIQELATQTDPMAFRNGKPFTTSLGGGRFRIEHRTLTADGSELPIVLMASLSTVDSQLAKLATSLALAMPVAVIAAAAVSYGLARRAMAPVEKIRRLADEITADRLDQRIASDNPNDELGQLCATINGMVGRLQQSFCEIKRFTADASHEIRSPLAVIRAEAEVALTETDPDSSATAALASILEECCRMTRLTDQLLQLAREEGGAKTFAIGQFDISELIREIVDAISPIAEAKSIAVRTELGSPAMVRGDANRLRQVFINLLDNAIKYSPPESRIGVRVDNTPAEVIIAINDAGEGIAPEHLGMVFERFFRVDKARSRELGGTGLGLSIARSIVQTHGGRIEVSSTLGKGSTFVVALPNAAEAAKARQIN